MARQAMFAGLVYDEFENLVATTFVGGEPNYVIDDKGFKRHIDAEEVDRQYWGFFESWKTTKTWLLSRR